MDAVVALVSALRQQPNASTIDFSTWPFLNQFCVDYHIGYGRKEAMVKADGFIHLRADKPNSLEPHAFFLELDRSTESLSILADKAIHYRAYYRSGGFAERSGGHPDAYRTHPFRVLMVCKSEARCDNAARWLLSIDPPIKTMVWLTTLKEILLNPLGPIWVRPADYQGHHAALRRQVGMLRTTNALLPAAIKKHSLFPEMSSVARPMGNAHGLGGYEESIFSKDS
jgi:hypothetical protein